MSAPVESQIFELERLEASLGAILAGVANVPIHTRFTEDTAKAPLIDVQLRIGQPTGRRYTGFATINQFSPYQPLNSWNYELDVIVQTERTQNGNQHVPLIGIARWTFQYYRLVDSLTEAISPFHTLTSCEELGQSDSVDDQRNVQMSKITFRGVCNIRDSAWPERSDELMFEPEDESIFTPSGSLMFYN